MMITSSCSYMINKAINVEVDVERNLVQAKEQSSIPWLGKSAAVRRMCLNLPWTTVKNLCTLRFPDFSSLSRVHKLQVMEKCLFEVTEFRIDIKVLGTTVEPPSDFSHKMIF